MKALLSLQGEPVTLAEVFALAELPDAGDKLRGLRVHFATREDTVTFSRSLPKSARVGEWGTWLSFHDSPGPRRAEARYAWHRAHTLDGQPMNYDETFHVGTVRINTNRPYSVRYSGPNVAATNRARALVKGLASLEIVEQLVVAEVTS